MAVESFRPADRIQELSEVNMQVATMVTAAGRAVEALADVIDTSSDEQGADAVMGDGQDANSLEARQQAFKTHTTVYYESLQEIIAKLRRQAYALEEAGIISAEAPTISSTAVPKQASTSQSQGRGGSSTVVEPDRITNGGLGNFDVGWLNSRGNKVLADKEAELMLEAKALLSKQIGVEIAKTETDDG